MTGSAISSFSGDFNGDGIPDFTIGSYATVGEGKTALLFGDVGTADLGTLTTDQGLVLSGGSTNERSGYDLALADDVNGDGLADLFIGAYQASNSTTQSGSAYLVFGRSDPLTATDLSSYTGGATGIRIDGANNNHLLGQSVATGDVNGDGCADLIVGATNASKAYVVFGGVAR